MDNYKDQFISHMVDELQTPLKAILKFSDTLIKNKSDIASQEKYLKLIHLSAKNLENIIKDVSDMSNLQNNTISIELNKVNLRDLLSQNFEIFRSKAREKTIRYSITFGKNLPKFIETDGNRLSQVISNLLSNAIKFTPKDGAVKLEVIFDQDKSVLKVFVDDNGPGIPDSKKADIFKPFIKDKTNVTFEDTRTGLGLSISLSIIELLNGKITFESSEEKGSTFNFEIPVKTYDD
ncbi:sensor histidine kinase [Sulfurimonas sp.]|uniref:sensor histidine kinase n=1 Tax=Sulfurimonas sp. TaxID=2022749 RepID=UPI0035640703